MEFLKELFAEPLSFELFQEAVNKKGLKLADISKGEYIVKDKFDKTNEALKSANDTIASLTGELQNLKDSGASAEEWKNKFEELEEEMKNKDAAAKAELEKAEREAGIKSRYDAVCVNKDGNPLEFIHEAVKAEYLKKFGDILSDIDNTEFKGKSDADIFHALTKDDAAAFRGVQAQVILKGGQQFGGSISKEDLSKMGYAERLKIKTEQPDLYQAITNSKGD